MFIDQEIIQAILGKMDQDQKETPASIHIEHLQVDKIIVEKLD